MMVIYFLSNNINLPNNWSGKLDWYGNLYKYNILEKTTEIVLEKNIYNLSLYNNNLYFYEYDIENDKDISYRFILDGHILEDMGELLPFFYGEYQVKLNIIDKDYEKIYAAIELVSNVERIYNSVYIKSNPEIKIISSTNYITDVFSSGYNLSFNTLDYEEFALSVLSLDKQYDVAYMSSRQDFSSNIRDKGSFYPLNDIPEVMEFLDNCFPYIKEAATDDSGNIWMIPIDVGVPVIIYNEKNCTDIEIDFKSMTTTEQLINNVKKAGLFENLNTNYWFNKYPIIQTNVLKFLRNSKTLDTNEFKNFAKLIKDNANLQFGDSSAINNFAFMNENPQFLFSSEDSRILQTRSFLINRNELSAISIQDMTLDEKNSAMCIYLTVNPNSNNLQSTLEYITAVCEYLMSLNNSFMFTDKSKYTSSNYITTLYQIYENSIIDFNVSDEVFMNDFNKYINDDFNIDDFIKEVDRKLAMYYNE